MLALVLLGIASLLAFGFGLAIAARLLRPSNLQLIMAGNLPTVRGIKGRFRLLGQEFEANATFDDRLDDQLLALRERVAQLEDHLRVVQDGTLE